MIWAADRHEVAVAVQVADVLGALGNFASALAS